MYVNQSPFFKKIIIPWYDSDAWCIVTLVVMIVVVVFALLGISAALETAEYRNAVWVPLLLALMSLGVAVSTSVRLIMRRIRRFSI